MKKLDEEAVGAQGHGGGFRTCWHWGGWWPGACSRPVLTGPPPAAPEEDELQRHPAGHSGFAPGEAEGPEDAVYRAQWQRQEHERVSGEAPRAGPGDCAGPGGWEGLLGFQPHAALLSAGTPSPSEADLPCDPLPDFNIK